MRTIPKFCKPFLERILGIKISHIEYPKSQETIDISADAKSVRLDIYVEDGKNTVYNIEMQTNVNSNLPKRTSYYQGMIDLNILEKGKNYKDLKRSFVIFVCTFESGILPPAEYKASKGSSCQTCFKVKEISGWTSVAVRRILTNEVYIGNLVQGRQTTCCPSN